MLLNPFYFVNMYILVLLLSFSFENIYFISLKKMLKLQNDDSDLNLEIWTSFDIFSRFHENLNLEIWTSFNIFSVYFMKICNIFHFIKLGSQASLLGALFVWAIEKVCHQKIYNILPSSLSHLLFELHPSFS